MAEPIEPEGSNTPASIRLNDLARMLDATWPQVQDKDRDERQRLIATYGAEAGKTLWDAIGNGELTIPEEIRGEAAGWADAGKWHQVFLCLVQRWLPTVRPGIGGPEMGYPDSHLAPGATVGPSGKLAKAYSHAMRALAELCPGGGPRPQADKGPLLLLGQIDRWKITAVDQVDDIGAWRHDSNERQYRYHGWLSDQDLCRFHADTMAIVGGIVKHCPNLDTKPVKEIYGAISSWTRTYEAQDIPEQAVLFGLLEHAITAVNVLQERLLEADEELGRAARLGIVGPLFPNVDSDPMIRALMESGYRGSPEDMKAHLEAYGAIAQPGDTSKQDEPRHSVDFRCVSWFGTTYEFTATQAACVKVMWEDWENGTPTVGEQTILTKVDSSATRLRDVFEKGNHPAWGTMIVPAGKGAFRLETPDEKF